MKSVDLSPEQRGKTAAETADGVFLLDPEVPSGGILSLIRRDFEKNIPPDLDWENFVIGTAKTRWQDYLPQPKEARRPTPEELSRLFWSDLVPESLKDPKELDKLVALAWDCQEAFTQQRIEPGKYIVVGGTMGTGKSELVRALAGFRPFDSIYFSEAWEDNKELPMFYRLLEIWANPACRASGSSSQIAQELKNVQGKVQGWFASRKFIQALISTPILGNFSLIQDTPLGQDGVYAETQYELGLASQENIAAYRQDNQQRRRLLPPFIQRPVLVYVWAPFGVTRERILKVRGRDFESQLPKDYLLNLHLNTFSWVLAMAQSGIPVLVVDADARDFRPGMSDRRPVVAKIWQEIDKIDKIKT